MAKFIITIDSILGGIAPNLYIGRRDQFAMSIGIDPDLPISDSGIKASGVLVPTSYADISGAGLSGYVKWLLTCPQNELVYAYASDGELISYSILDSTPTETVIGTPTSGVGNGAAYYNNYIYLATPTNISRYGPLDNSPSLTNTVWTGALFGKTALGDPTYPTQYGILYPNHPMHVHSDNKLYVGDFETVAGDNQGRGKIHWIRTNGDATNEGADNDGTTENALYLPYSYAPIDIESWGNDLAILAIPMHTATTASSSLVQGKAALFLWDAINASSLPYRKIDLIDPFASALLNHNGDLYVWSGNLNDGVRLSKYLGGYKLQQVAFFEEGAPPPAGCVDGQGNRIVWGARTTFPENATVVYGYGYKDANLPPALHSIMTTTDATAGAASFSSAMVSALKFAQQASFIIPRLLVAWLNGVPDRGIDRRAASSFELAVWRSLTYSIGQPFKINKISIPLGAAVAGSMTLVPSIRVDDDSTTFTLTTINSTNYAGSQRRIIMYTSAYGVDNFNLQLRWTGTALLPVTLPIVIEVETLEDATG